VYPKIEPLACTASMRDFGAVPPMTVEVLKWFARHYEGTASRSNYRLSPLASDLSGLAPAIVITAGIDPLCDEGEAYALKLHQSGVPTTHWRFDRLPHGFLSMGLVASANRASRDIARLVRMALTTLL
jgi:acetyl esterase/lipase